VALDEDRTDAVPGEADPGYEASRSGANDQHGNVRRLVAGSCVDGLHVVAPLI
jgi:hypothetical protein